MCTKPWSAAGDIRLIRNQDIKEQLQALEQTYNFINRLEETHLTASLSQIIPDIKETFRLNPFKVERPETLYSYQFQNNFDLFIGLMLEKMQAYDQAENEINYTIELIDQELVYQ